MTYEELTDALAAKLDIDGLVRQDGICSVDIDGIIVSMIYMDESDEMVLHGVVGNPPPEEEARFSAMLLRANNLFLGTGGATLSQDPETREYAMQRLFPLSRLDADTLVAELEKFVNAIELWKDRLEDFRPAAEEAAKAAVDDVMPSFLDVNGFTSV